MLTYKVSNKNIKREVTKLVNPSISVYTEDRTLLQVETTSAHKLSVGSEVLFERIDGKKIQYQDKRILRKVSGKNKFFVDYFPDYVVPIKIAGIFDYRIKTGVTAESYIEFFCDKDKQHYFEKNRDDITIKEYIFGDYTEPADDIRRCNGDYILYEDNFTYKANPNSTGTKYNFTAIQNITNAVIYTIPNSDLIEFFETYQASGTNWRYEDGKLYLSNCIVPSTNDGADDNRRLLWKIDRSDFATKLVNACPSLTFYAQDTRFYNNGYVLYDSTALYNIDYSLLLPNLFTENFGEGLLQEEALKEYMNELIEKGKNKIVDYEKQMFIPVDGSTEEEEKELTEIKFNLHFKKRKPFTETDEQGNVIGGTYGEWKAEDDADWNDIEETHSDLLGHLGFTDDDVYYRKKKLEKSFLRLSFYDTQDRRTQNLLFTSTIFMDVASKYGALINNIKYGVAKGKCPIDQWSNMEGYVYTDGTEENSQRVDSSFVCKSKYHNDMSSEGFYLYLFPSLVKNGSAIIYMKAEFNHAKYGYKIPFVNKARNTYKGETSGYSYVDMKKLWGDMYIPIEIKKKDGKYVWKIDKVADSEGKITINLYEPRVNS